MDQMRGIQAMPCSTNALGPRDQPASRDLVTIDMSSKIRIAPHLRKPNGVNFKCNDHVMEKMDDRPIRKCTPGVYLTPREYSASRPLRSGADLAPAMPSRGYYTDTERVYQKTLHAQIGEHNNNHTVLPQPHVRARDPLARQFDALLLAMPQSLSKDTELPNSLKQRVVLDPGVRRPTMPKVGTNPHKERVVRESRIRGKDPENEHTPVSVSPFALTRPSRQQLGQQTTNTLPKYLVPDASSRREGAEAAHENPMLVNATRTLAMDRPVVCQPLPETRKKGKSFWALN